MTAPGPAELGRGVVVHAGRPAPPAWAGAPVVTVDEAVLGDPGPVVADLHRRWAARQPVVVALGVDPARFRSPASWTVEPWTLDPGFEAWSDRLHFLVWANTYDARAEGAPVWWWARKAERLGARATPAGPADVVLPDGRPAWVDGGPRGPVGAGGAAGAGPVLVHAESVELGRLSEVPRLRPPSAPLAPDQLAAVAHTSGPARVIAPAGSGKTRVLTERLRHLVVDRGFEREAVLAVAYNKKAQQELEQRCSSFGPRVQTLNALGYRLLAAAQGRAPRLVEEREVRDLLADLVPKRPRRANTDPMAAYLEGLSAIRLGLRDPEVVEAEGDDVPGLAAAFGPYRKRLAAAGAVDFDDQVYGAVEALLADGGFRRRMQETCRHLLVDEFQDLTPAHVLMLRLLATPRLDVFGVGDDDQVIYGHAGADPAFLVDFEALFPGAADHPLEVNYRCPVAVVEAAGTLLSYNHRRVAKHIRAGPGADPAPDALAVRTHRPEAGATALVEVVQRWLAEGAEPAEVAVLTRVNSLLLVPHLALAEAGVAVDSALRPDVLSRTGTRAALAYLRIAADPGRIDGADLAEVYRRPSRGLPQWIVKWFRGTFTVPRLRSLAGRIDEKGVGARVEELVDDLELVIAAAQGGSTRDVLAVVKDGVGLGRAMGLLDGPRSGEGSSHLDDLEALEQVASLHPDPAGFEPWLRAAFRRQAVDGGVTLSTVHRVKGREWPRVVVFGATAGLMPHRLADDEEEERRVMHVAITRGRRRVAVLADAARPSPFLAELTGASPRRPPGGPAGARGAGAAGSAGASGDGAGRGRGADAAASAGASGGPAAGGGGRRTGASVAGRGRRPGPAAGDVPLSPEAQQAEAALRAWRRRRCQGDGVPAFVVLSDRHLRGVAVARPRSLGELRAVEGIGPTKLDLYGEEILAVLDGLDPPPATG